MIQWNSLTEFTKTVLRKIGLVGMSEYEDLIIRYVSLEYRCKDLYDHNLKLMTDAAGRLPVKPFDFDVSVSRQKRELAEYSEIYRITLNPKKYSVEFMTYGLPKISDPIFENYLRNYIDDLYLTAAQEHYKEVIEKFKRNIS